MATTPPLRSSARTPPAPLYGAKYDSYEPYTIRKSTRFSAQRAARTPSPNGHRLHPQSKSSSRSGKSATVVPTTNPYSPPSSAQTSPQKKTRKTAYLGLENKPTSTTQNGGHNKPENPQVANSTLKSNQTNLVPNMLPTPVKTPRKKQAQTTVTSTARILFPNRPDNVDEAMPTPHKRKSKRHVGFSLGSFCEDDDASSDGKIEIYTDSKDKLPEIDEAEDNPFYEKPSGQPPSTNRSTKRRKVSNKIDHSEEVQEALARNEGMVYVFRGKRIFRKFAVSPDGSGSSPIGLDTGASTSIHIEADESPHSKHFTRSSIKPRLLFPSTKQSRNDEPDMENTDEEAVTDIEDRHPAHGGITEVAPDTEEEPLVTPVKTTFTPSTPPTTGHATRASTKKAALDSSPLAPEPVEMLPHVLPKARKPSPFDAWRRTKGRSEPAGKGKKRAAEVTDGDVEGSKRIRGHVN